MGEEKELITGCPSCGSRYRVPPEFRARTLCCKKCGTSFKVGEPPKAETREEKPDLIETGDPNLLMGNLLTQVSLCQRGADPGGHCLSVKGEEGGAGMPSGRDPAQERRHHSKPVELSYLDPGPGEGGCNLRFGALALQNGFVTQEQGATGP